MCYRRRAKMKPVGLVAYGAAILIGFGMAFYLECSTLWWTGASYPFEFSFLYSDIAMFALHIAVLAIALMLYAVAAQECLRRAKAGNAGD